MRGRQQETIVMFNMQQQQQISISERSDNRKRRRKAKTESAIHSLSYDLLLEILIRVGDVRSVIRCSVVCKYWFSIIHSADFHHARIGSRSESSLPSTFIFRFDNKGNIQDRKPMYEYHSKQSHILYRRIKSREDHFLSFLPWQKVRIFSTFNDLLLVSPDSNIVERLTICNPFTRQWVELPKLPKTNSFSQIGGFLCEPCEQQQPHRQLKLDQYRYRVMVLFTTSKVFGTDYDSGVDFTILIFSSETRKWRVSKSSFPTDLDRNSPIACNGMLHWLEETVDMTYTILRLVAFDPFKENPLRHRYYIDFPSDLRKGQHLSNTERLRIGLVKGRLRLSQLLPNKERGVGFVLKVWELNYNKNDGLLWSWTLVHNVEVNSKYKSKLFVIAFHFDNGNIIFLLRGCRHIYRYDIAREKMKQVGKLPRKGIKSFPVHLRVYNLMHPLWPSLLPSV